MTQVIHVLGKDLRRLRWLLLLWAAVLSGRVLLQTIGPSYTADTIEGAFMLRQLGGLVNVLEILMAALIAARLIHEEPLVGLDAFWVTRPYNRWSLLTEKLTVAVAALIVMPFAADVLTMSVFGAGAAAQVQAAPSLAAGYARWTLAFMVVGVLTPSTSVFILAIVGVVAAAAGALALLLMVAVMFSEESPRYARSMVVDPTPTVVAFLTYAVAALAVIGYQYRYRRWKVAVALSIAGLVLIPAVSAAWPWSLAGRLEPDPGAWARDPSATPAILDTTAPTQTSQAYSARRTAAPHRYIHGLVRLSAMPPELAINNIAARSTLTLPSGVKLQSEQMNGLSQRRLDRPPGVPWNPQLETVLGGARLLASSSGGEYEFWPALLTVSDAEFQRHRGEAGRLEALLDVHLTRWRRLATLPLAAGADDQEPFRRIQIVRVERSGDGAVAFVRSWTTRSPLAPELPSSEEFVLLNRARGEALGATHEPWGMAGVSLSISGMGFFVPPAARRGFVVREDALHFPGTRYGTGSSRPRIDAAWLDGAELVLVETTYAGRVTRTLTADGFVIPNE